MKKVCVIGATSPLGITLVPAMAEAGYSVAGAYRNEQLVPAEWQVEERIEPFHLDLKSDDPLPGLACDALVWLAHLDAGRLNEAEPETNLRAFNRVLSRFEGSEVGKIIFISSGGSIYGHANTLPLDENHERKPISSYGLAKKVLEDKLIEFGGESRISTAILRPGNIYGFERPGRKTKGVIGAFLNALARNEPFTLIHGGRTVRDMVYVDDVCEAIRLAIESAEPKIIWNVGTARGTPVIEILNRILFATGRSMPDTLDQENFDTDVLSNVLSNDRIRTATGWIPETDLDEGLSKTLKFWSFPEDLKRSHASIVDEIAVKR